MKRLAELIFYHAYNRHCKYAGKAHTPHTADYTVCRDPFCYLAYWLERVTRFQERVNAGEWRK